MTWKKFLGIAAVVAVLVTCGCSERVPPVAPGGSNDAPSEYNGPSLGASLAVTDGVTAVDGYEWIGNTHIVDASTAWGATRFNNVPFAITTYAGHWYNAMLVRDGKPVLGGYTLAGVTPHQAWMDENKGVFFAQMILVSDNNEPVIWQWGSNLGSLVIHDVEVLNWTDHPNLGLVGTTTSFSSLPAHLTPNDSTWTTTMQSPSGDCKLAVVNVDTGIGLADSVTILVNGVELTSYVDDFVHPRQPGVTRYFRYHVAQDGKVTSLGTENRWTYGNRVRAMNPDLDPEEAVYVEADFTHGSRLPMSYIGSWTWELGNITTWVGPQTLQVVTESGTRVFNTVEWNGVRLVHLAVIPLDPDPPIQAFRFTPKPLGVEQDANNLLVDLGVGGGSP